MFFLVHRRGAPRSVLTQCQEVKISAAVLEKKLKALKGLEFHSEKDYFQVENLQDRSGSYSRFIPKEAQLGFIKTASEQCSVYQKILEGNVSPSV